MLPNWCIAALSRVQRFFWGRLLGLSAWPHRAMFSNLACNSHGNLSCIEKWSLQFQRFRELLTSDAGELHAAVGELQH